MRTDGSEAKSWHARFSSFEFARAKAPKLRAKDRFVPLSGHLHRKNAAVRENLCFWERVKAAWGEFDRQLWAGMPPSVPMKEVRITKPNG